MTHDVSIVDLVSYVPEFERNLISLGRLKANGCFLKASDWSLKIIKGEHDSLEGEKE